MGSVDWKAVKEWVEADLQKHPPSVGIRIEWVCTNVEFDDEDTVTVFDRLGWVRCEKPKKRCQVLHGVPHKTPRITIEEATILERSLELVEKAQKNWNASLGLSIGPLQIGGGVGGTSGKELTKTLVAKFRHLIKTEIEPQELETHARDCFGIKVPYGWLYTLTLAGTVRVCRPFEILEGLKIKWAGEPRPDTSKLDVDGSLEFTLVMDDAETYPMKCEDCNGNEVPTPGGGPDRREGSRPSEEHTEETTTLGELEREQPGPRNMLSPRVAPDTAGIDSGPGDGREHRDG